MRNEKRTGQDIIDLHNNDECVFKEQGDLKASHIYGLVTVFYEEILDENALALAQELVELLATEQSTEGFVLSRENYDTGEKVIQVWKDLGLPKNH